MSASDYLLLSAAFAGAVVVIGVAAGKKPRKKKESVGEETRWKRFRIHCGLLHKAVEEASHLVIEEPSGLKLILSPTYHESPSRIHVLGSDGRPAIEIIRGGFFSRGQIKTRLHGRSWLRVKPPKPGEKRPSMRFASSGDALEIGGNPSSREYEMRRKGKLVATVSWQRPPGDEAPRKDYVLEALKTEDPFPPLALALSLEVVLPPPKVEKKEPPREKR